jgi:D-3-phosphoglycerate dehydrogenase / 2-oxoglutarate reductase
VSQPFRVIIADDMSPRAAEVLAASKDVAVDVRAGISAEELASVIGDYHAIVVRSRTKVTAALIEAAAKLRLIGRAGIGVDNIDVAAASRRGVVVENAPSGNSVTTAEHALCLLAALARHIPQADASMKAGKWEKKKFQGTELMGKTLGVLGLGNIGRILAHRAQGLMMNVIAYDPFIGQEAAEQLGVELVSLDELYSRADALSCHTPLTSETRGLLGDEAFAKMKPGVLIVNASRGGVVDEAALLRALDGGKVGGAALDVFEEEPPRSDSGLVKHPNVVCTPHLGASTEEAQEKVAVEIAEQVVAFAERGEIRNALNVQSVSGEVKTRLSPWLELATHLGSLVGQLSRGDFQADGFIDEIAVQVTGEAAEKGATACTSAALVGLLGIFMDGPINEINASFAAKERGLKVDEVKSQSGERDLTSAIALTARSGNTTRYVKGTLYHIGDRIEPRVVQIDNFLVEATPSGHILAVLNQDRPGVIGAVGSLLGERGINVNSLHVGLDEGSGVALALWNLDAQLGPDLIQAVRDLAQVEKAQLIDL